MNGPYRAVKHEGMWRVEGPDGPWRHCPGEWPAWPRFWWAKGRAMMRATAERAAREMNEDPVIRERARRAG